MSEGRKISILIPYKIIEKEIFVFLQKRAKDAKRLPDHFGFFGGGLEGEEMPEEALLREMYEELDFVPEGYRFLDSYEFGPNLKHIYFLEAGDDFEDHITVFEGDYGKYFSEKEALDEPKFGEEDKVVLRDFYKLLKSKNE